MAFAQGGPPAMPVGVAEPVAKRVTQWDEFSGRFEALASVEVRARVSGFIDKLHFRDGQIVKAAGPGEHFGERALLSDGIWRFDATATESSELVAIDGQTFKTLAQSIGSLDALFRGTAQQYHLPEEIQNTVDMMRVLQELYAAGEPISVTDVEYLSPYMTYGVKRFGNYHLDLKRPPEPWVKESQFREAAKRARAAAAEAQGAASSTGAA